MKILKVLKSLVHYYSVVRQVGHTTTMLEGAKYNDNCVILVHNYAMGIELQKMAKKKLNIVTIDDEDGLVGRNQPLVIDNAAVLVLCVEAVNEIDQLTEENSDLRERLASIQRIINGV